MVSDRLIKVRYGLRKEYIESLETIDEYLLRKIFKTGSKVPKESLYLESGAIPIKYIVMGRRLNYLHHILSRNETELISKVYKAQRNNPAKNDWYIQVQSDIIETKLNMKDKDISRMKKIKFKHIVKEKVKNLALLKLLEIKSSHSKGKETQFKKLEKQEYLKSKVLTKKQKSLLFNLRFRMTNMKINFKNMYTVYTCDLCKEEEDSIQHCLECPVLLNNCSELYNDRIVKFDDLFGSVVKQVRAVQLFEKILEKREELLEQLITDSS